MKYHFLSMALWIKSGLFAVCYAILWHRLFRKTWKMVDSFSVMFRSSRPEVLWKYTANLQESNFIKITLRHGCSPVNLLHIFRTRFPGKTSGNTSGWLLLNVGPYAELASLTIFPFQKNYIEQKIQFFLKVHHFPDKK